MVDWSDWWSWELDLSTHLLKRMLDRRFNEADLRLMLDDASEYHVSDQEGRFVIKTRRDRQLWEIIVEPLYDEQILLVITAYPLD